MANRIPIKAIFTGSDVTSLGEFASSDTIDVSYIADGTITAAKLAADTATQAELDTVSTVASAALPKAGGAMTGAITTNSTFDTRDVATDGTKLDTVETNADVTDTLNVTSAGALMDSEVTNLADVKAFDTTDYATAAQGTTANAALPKAGGAMTGAITTNSTFDTRDVATDGAKLDLIEANATADQTNAEIKTAVEAGSDIALGGNPTTTTQAESDDSTKIATTAYVTDKITTLIGGAPSTLNDLNELAAAINDDADYNSTLTTALATKLPKAGGAMTGDIDFGDNVKANFGASDDLQIYHDGSNSYIDDTGTGYLKIKTSDRLDLQSATGEKMIRADANSEVTLYHNDAAKLATTATGVDVTGVITTDGLTTSADISFGDNDKAKFGASDDLQIYHDGSHSQISEVGTGNLYIQASSLRLNNGGGTAPYLQANDGSDVKLFHNGLQKLATTATGVDVTGNVGVSGTVDGVDVATRDGVLTTTTTTADAALPKAGGEMTGNVGRADNIHSRWGTGNDLDIYHDGSHSYIKDNGTGDLRLMGTNLSLRSESTNEPYLNATENGAVTLYYNNASKFATTSEGVSITGLCDASTGQFRLDSNHRLNISDTNMAFVLDGAEDMRLENDGDLHVDGDVIAYSTTVSDERLKTGIMPITNALSKVNQLNGCTFTYTTDGKESAGLIAQDVEKVLPSAVTEKELPLKQDDGKEYKVLQYDQTIGLLVEAIKELTAKVEELENK